MKAFAIVIEVCVLSWISVVACFGVARDIPWDARLGYRRWWRRTLTALPIAFAFTRLFVAARRRPHQALLGAVDAVYLLGGEKALVFVVVFFAQVEDGASHGETVVGIFLDLLG